MPDDRVVHEVYDLLTSGFAGRGAVTRLLAEQLNFEPVHAPLDRARHVAPSLRDRVAEMAIIAQAGDFKVLHVRLAEPGDGHRKIPRAVERPIASRLLRHFPQACLVAF